ncbi:MAG: hypothetical protein ACO3QC_03415 [Phycisphaerales bacterium]
MEKPAPRPSFAPENRSSKAGKIVAVAVFALLLLGGLATLIVVLNRGSAGIVQPLKGEPGGPPADQAGPYGR